MACEMETRINRIKNPEVLMFLLQTMIARVGDRVKSRPRALSNAAGAMYEKTRGRIPRIEMTPGFAAARLPKALLHARE